MKGRREGVISLLTIPRAEGRARELPGEETPSCPAALGRGWLMLPALERESRALPHHLCRLKGPGLLLRHRPQGRGRAGRAVLPGP